jgi:ferredoxin
LNTENQLYRQLQQHLDDSPEGFAPAASGADIRILQRLFTPEEARIALQLSTYQAEPVRKIWQRLRKSGLNLSLNDLQSKLDKMVFKGTTLAFHEGYKETHYQNAGVSAGGIYDFQVNRLTPELIKDFDEYHMESFNQKDPEGPKTILPLRTVPVSKSIPLPAQHLVATYEDTRKLVQNAKGKIAVANCVCRQTKDIQGTPCKHNDLRETCLQIGTDHARQYVEMGIARYITKEEAFQILEKAEAAGFILQPENSQHPEAICCCCGDCCGLLSKIVKSPRPADLYVTNYRVEVDSAKCSGCGTCVKRCQLDARILDGKTAKVNPDRCIGCGNCVVTCETKATRLVLKGHPQVPPKDKDAMYMENIARKRGKWNTFKLKLKRRLGIRV